MHIDNISVNLTKNWMASMGAILVRVTFYFGYELVIIPSFSYEILFRQNKPYLPNPEEVGHNGPLPPLISTKMAQNVAK